MKTNITPGPWTLENSIQIKVGNFSIDVPWDCVDVDEEGHIFQAKANAQAISAVPEMIACLIAARQAIIDAGNVNHDPLFKDINNALEKAGVK